MASIALARPAARRRPVGRLRRSIGWLLIVAGTAGYLYAALLRPWHTRWGATDDEVERALPGDELVASPIAVTTRAISVNAPPEAIWPWIAQLGQGRGGFYSYEWIENTLLRCDIHNADAVVPAWQRPAVGDLVRMSPDPAMPPAYVVAQVHPGRALVLGHRVGLSDDPASPWADSWQFVIEPAPGGASRLIVRTRSFETPWVNRLLEPAIFLMEERMLRGIKARAEGLAAGA